MALKTFVTNKKELERKKTATSSALIGQRRMNK